MKKQTAKTTFAKSRKESIDDFRSAFEQAGIGAAHVSLDGNFLRVNDKLCEITGYSRTELLDLTFAQITVSEDTEVSQRSRDEMTARRKKSFVAEKRYRRKDGSVVWVKLTATLVSKTNEADAFFISIIEDISERKAADLHLLRMNRLYKVLSKINDLIIRVSNRLQLYEALCRILVEDGLLLMSFIVDVDAESGAVKPVASWGETGDYLKQVTIATATGPLSQGTVGTAIRTGRYDVCNDLASDPRMAPWRSAALAQQFNATAAFPLMISGKACGALVMGSAEVGYFQSDEIELMVTVANNLAFAVEALQKDAESRRSEAAVTESEARFRQLAENIQEVFWLSDVAKQEMLYVSPNFEKIWGISCNELYRSPLIWLEAICPEDRERILVNALTKQVAGEYNEEYRIIRPDGESRWISDRGFPIRDAAGKVYRIAGVAQDITEGKRALEKIRQNENLLAIAGHIARLGAWRYDVGAEFVVWSDEVCAIHEVPFGTSPNLEQGINYYAPEYREAITQAVGACIKEGTAFDLELQIITAKNRRVWVRAIGNAEKNEMGSIVRVQGAFQDISLQRELASELDKERARLISAQAVAKVGSWETDLATLAVTWSEETHHIFETDPKTFNPTHETFLDFVHPDDRAAVDEAFLRSQDEDGIFIISHRALLPGNKIKYLEERWQIFHDSQGKAIRAFGTCQDVTERHLAEEKTLNLELNLSKTLESITDGFVTVDGNWLFTYANPEAERILQSKPHALIGKSFWDKFAEIHGTPLRGRLEHAVREQESVQFESFYAPFKAWLEVRAYPSDQGLAIYFRDVSGEHLARENLRKSEERFRELAEKIREIFYILEPESGRVLYVSPAYEAVWGRSCQSLLADPLSYLDDIHPEDRATVEATYPRFLAGEPTIVEYRIFRPDGEMRWIRDYSYPVLEQNTQKVDHIVGVSHDITQKMLVEQKLREQASLLDIARDAIFVRDLDHKITYWNKSAEKLYGWTAAEAIGRRSIELIDRDTEFFRQASEKVMQDGEWVGELEKFTKTGKNILVESRWTLVRNGDRKAHSILAINTDITERRKFEQQMLRTQRLDSIGTLAGGIAHDLNNVFTPILMSIELLKEETATQENTEVLDMILSSARRGADMVAQILSFARGMEGRKTDIHLQNIANEMVKIIRETFPKNIQLRMNLDKDLGVIQGDSTQLHQVLLNLCVNARDAMPDGGHLSISMQNTEIDEQYAAMIPGAKTGKHILIRVADTGSGMPQNILEKIFDPFFTTKDIGQGTGLGLSTTLAIIRGHGGYIQTQSEVGKGTRFDIFLPVAAQLAPQQSAPVVRELLHGGGETVLLVDDEVAIRQVTGRTLEAFGYHVLQAAEGTEAVVIYAEHEKEIAVVIIDMMMPGMDGPATIQVLRRMNPGIRIIATSGIEASYNKDLKAEYFLRKPYTANTLLSALKDLLNAEKNERT